MCSSDLTAEVVEADRCVVFNVLADNWDASFSGSRVPAGSAPVAASPEESSAVRIARCCRASGADQVDLPMHASFESISSVNSIHLDTSLGLANCATAISQASIVPVLSPQKTNSIDRFYVSIIHSAHRQRNRSINVILYWSNPTIYHSEVILSKDHTLLVEYPGSFVGVDSIMIGVGKGSFAAFATADEADQR